MMTFNRLIAICFIALIMLNIPMASAMGNDECLYDFSNIEKPSYLSDRDVSKAYWDDAKKTAKILTKNKEKLTVIYTACENFGIEAELTTQVIRENALTRTFVINKIMWLTKKIIKEPKDILRTKEIVLGPELNKFFPKGVYNQSPALLTIPSTRYTDLTIELNSKNGQLIIVITAISA